MIYTLSEIRIAGVTRSDEQPRDIMHLSETASRGSCWSRRGIDREHDSLFHTNSCVHGRVESLGTLQSF